MAREEIVPEAALAAADAIRIEKGREVGLFYFTILYCF
jgi:hypothetical protein